MMQLKLIIVAVVIFCGHQVAAQNITRCLIGNSTCEEASYIAVAINVISNGAPALGIPSMNPFYLSDVPVPFLSNMIQATLVEGACYDISTCRLLYFRTDVKTFRKLAEIQCDRIVINGTYTIATNPIFAKLFGNIHGSGKVSITAEDWYFMFNYTFKFVQHDDGEIYTEPDFAAGNYISKVLKNFNVAFDNIMMNDRDITALVVFYINKFWRVFLETVGRPFHIVSVDFYYAIYERYFSGVPATSFYLDDLNQYLSKTLE